MDRWRGMRCLLERVVVKRSGLTRMRGGTRLRQGTSGPQGSEVAWGSVHQSSFRTKCSGTSLILFVMPINSQPWPTIIPPASVGCAPREADGCPTRQLSHRSACATPPPPTVTETPEDGAKLAKQRAIAYVGCWEGFGFCSLPKKLWIVLWPPDTPCEECNWYRSQRRPNKGQMDAGMHAERAPPAAV